MNNEWLQIEMYLFYIFKNLDLQTSIQSQAQIT